MPNETKKILGIEQLAHFKSLLANVSITNNYGDLDGIPFWIGTQTEYDEQSSTIPNDTVIFITDNDGNVIQINYLDVINKPQINGNTLEGNKTGSQLGLVDAMEGKGLSTEDFTTDLLYKLNSVSSGAQANVIESITVNGTEQIVTNKTIALNIMTNAVNDLVNYYKKSETYTQTEINSLVSAIPKFSVKVVDTLPATDISNTTIYLLRTSETETGNLFTEYIYAEITNGTYQWEKLGSQTLDLSGYVTTESLNTLLNNKVDKVEGKGLSTNDFTSDEKTKLNNISPGAQVNTIETISVNGTVQAISDKNVNLTVPKKIIDLDDVWVGTQEEYETAQNIIPKNTLIFTI